MLIGAMQSIREYSPNLAICIYHNVVDFYQIQMLIHEINPNYKVIIRHHSYNLAETILYAWI